MFISCLVRLALLAINSTIIFAEEPEVKVLEVPLGSKNTGNHKGFLMTGLTLSGPGNIHTTSKNESF